MNRTLRKTAFFITGLYLLLFAFLTYVQIYRGEALMAHPKNRRSLELEKSTVRGNIYDSKGRLLAGNKQINGRQVRVWPYGAAAAPVTGYVSERYGKTGLEGEYNQYLLGLDPRQERENFWRRLTGRQMLGDHIYLTVDAELQSLAYRLLKGRRGAVVVLDPATGAVLALVTSPSFDPAAVDTEFKRWQKEDPSPLFNRALNGLYPPGSTMKVVTGALILEKDPAAVDRLYESQGSLLVEGFVLKDHSAFGWLNFYEAYQYSSNVVFARMGLQLGGKDFKEGAEKFGFNGEIPFELPVDRSTTAPLKELWGPELASEAIGQGKLLATPLQMALVAAAVANDGKIMKPYLVSKITDYEGKREIYRATPVVWQEPFSSSTAALLKKALVGVVERGTGKAAAVPGVKVAGKTGTAQNPHGASHAWFIGFAPAEKPRVAVAVILENSGYGGVEAAPVAAEIIKAALAEGDQR
ncbi:MAG: penicillin-binding protein [Eubacteriales bacterium]|nr:penicillin-binding protein [Eubacteriales bacterium]